MILNTRHPTQLIEAAALAGLSVYFLKKRAFIIQPISIYLMSYGALRVFIELLRDDGVRGLWGPLTPSLWISFGLILGGVILIYINKIKLLR
jgi:prolipoprotein diacylglyceryltransferase